MTHANRSGSGSLTAWARIILAGFGVFIAGTLTLSHLGERSLFCGGSLGCDSLALDDRSRLFGVPLAGLGLLSYLLLLALSVLQCSSLRGEVVEKCGRWLSFLGVCASAFLVLRLTFEIRLTCLWCVASAVTMSLLAIAWVSAPEVVSNRSLPRAIVVSIGIPAVLLMSYHLGYRSSALRPSIDRAALSRESFSDLAPRDAIWRGPSSAQHVIVVFTDLECSACHSTMPELFAAVRPRSGCALVVRHYPLDMHPAAYQMAVKVETSTNATAVEAAFGGDLQSFRAMSHSRGRPLSEARRRVDRDLSMAKRLHVPGTPTLILAEPKGAPTMITIDDAVRMLKGS